MLRKGGIGAVGGKVSKLTSKLQTSASHIGKRPQKFKFDLNLERITGLKEGQYYVKWFRGTKGVGTKPRKVNSKECKEEGGAPFLENISLTSTLYRDEQTNQFDAKDTKVLLMQVRLDGENRNDRIVGKNHIDLSHYIGVPSLTTEVNLALNKTVVVAKVTITCTFIKSSKVSGTPSSDAGSRFDGASSVAGDDDFDDLDDLNDLGIDDDLNDLDFDMGSKSICRDVSTKTTGPPETKSRSGLATVKSTTKSSQKNRAGNELDDLDTLDDLPGTPVTGKTASARSGSRNFSSLKSNGDSKLKQLEYENAALKKEYQSLVAQNAERAEEAKRHSNSLQEQCSKLKNELHQCAKERDAYKHKSKDSSTALSTTAAENAKLVDDLSSVHSQLAVSKAELEESSKDARSNAETCKILEKEREKINRELDDIRTKMKQLSVERDNAAQDRDDAEEVTVALRQRLENMQKATNEKESVLSESRERLTQEVDQLKHEMKKLSAKHATAVQDRDDAEEVATALREKIQNLQASAGDKAASQEEKNRGLEVDLQNLRKELRSAESENGVLKETMADVSKLVESQRKELAELQQTIQENEEEKESSTAEITRLRIDRKETNLKISNLEQSLSSKTQECLSLSDEKLKLQELLEKQERATGLVEDDLKSSRQRISKLEKDAISMQAIIAEVQSSGADASTSLQTQLAEMSDNLLAKDRALDQANSSVRRLEADVQQREADNVNTRKSMMQQLETRETESLQAREAERIAVDRLGVLQRELQTIRAQKTNQEDGKNTSLSAELAEQKDTNIRLEKDLADLQWRLALTQEELDSEREKPRIDTGATPTEEDPRALEDRNEQLEDEIKDLKLAVTRMKEENDLLQETHSARAPDSASDAHEDIKVLQAEVDRLTEQRKRMSDVHNTLLSEHERCMEEIDNLKDEIEALQDQQDIQGGDSDLEILQEEKSQMEEELEDLRRRLEAQEETMEGRDNSSCPEDEDQDDLVAQLREELNDVKLQLQQATSQNDLSTASGNARSGSAIAHANESVAEALTRVDAERERLESENTSIVRDLIQTKLELARTKELIVSKSPKKKKKGFW